MTSDQPHQDHNPQQWPTMADRDSTWPVKQTVQPPTVPAADPLQVQHRKNLAPEPMPTSHTLIFEQPPLSPVVDSVQSEPQLTVCPLCGNEVTSSDSFCENCGGKLSPTSPPPPKSIGAETPLDTNQISNQAPKITDLDIERAPDSYSCKECSSVVGPDGYCTQCGAKAVLPRDHFVENPADWVAGCCDRGIRHHRNEDAIALMADPELGSRAVLVVCDGVSSSDDSDVASIAAARQARDVLANSKSRGVGTLESQLAVATQTMIEAAHAANEAVIVSTDPHSSNAASCTFAAAVVEQSVVHYGNVGDSRVYFISDDIDHSSLLSVDDSIAQQRILLGVSREEAESGPQAHAITKWLGRDSQDFTPRTGSIKLDHAGWVLVCSDGLWNYCSDPYELGILFHDLQLASRQARTPRGLADSLVHWACMQGGRDNISVALARHGDFVDLGEEKQEHARKNPALEETVPGAIPLFSQASSVAEATTSQSCPATLPSDGQSGSESQPESSTHVSEGR